MLSNPPFGKDWKNIREEIEAEHDAARRAATARVCRTWATGRCSSSCTSCQAARSGSKIAVIFNGSTPVNGDAGSGPSNIRSTSSKMTGLTPSWPPNDLFYNTGIAPTSG